MPFREYDDVRLVREFRGEGIILPAGSTAMVVRIDRYGAEPDSALIQMRRPLKCVTTVPLDCLEFDN